MNIAKKTLSSVVVTSTILWSMGASMLVGTLTANAAATDGSLIKAKEFDAVYYYQGGKRWTFPNLKTYQTWYKNFSTVQTVPLSELQTYQLAGNVVFRAGTRLVKITTDPKVYAVEPGGKLRWVTSESVAQALYGADWAKRVDDVSDAFFTNYSIGADLTTASYPDGSLLLNGSTYYYIQGGVARPVDAAAMSGNMLNSAYAITVASLSNTVGAALGATEVANVSQGSSAGQTTGGTTAPASTGSLTVSLASDSPSAGNSMVIDSEGGQKLARMTKVNLTANGADVVVTKLQAVRGGISKDADVDYLYLADANGAVLAKNNSFSLGVATFLNTAGLFTVPAGQTVSIWVLEDVNKGAGTGTTQSWTVDASGITTNSSGSVTGSAAGATFSVAAVTDLGRLEFATSSPLTPTNVDAGKIGYTFGTFKVVAKDQNILLKKMKFTEIGSIASSDLANLKVQIGGVQYDVTKSLSSDNTLVADFSKDSTGAANADGGLKILAGQSKFVDIVGDIVGGTNRNFAFSVQNTEDVVAYDLNYKVYVGTYALNTTQFAVQTLAASTINHGTLTLTTASDTATLNTALGGTNVSLAKFNFTAAGENVKVSSLNIDGVSTSSAFILKNVKLLLNGVQVGNSIPSLTANGGDNLYSFTNSFIVQPGTPSTLEVVADLNDATAYSLETIRVGITSGAAQGNVSLATVAVSPVSGNLLTLRTGQPSIQVNAAVANGSPSEPTAVLNDTNVKIASFILTGGAGEGSKITSIALADNGTALNTAFANIRLTDAAGNLLATNIAAGGPNSTYSFTINPTPGLTLGAGEQKVVNVVADVLSTVSAFTSPTVAIQVTASGVSYQTALTGLSGTVTMTPNTAQYVDLATAGSLTASLSSDTPVAQQVVMGAPSQPIFKFSLTAGKSEDVNVSELATAFGMSNAATSPTGLLQNIRLMDGDTTVGTVAALTSGDVSSQTDVSAAYARFSALNINIPKNTSKTFTVVAAVSATQDVYSGVSFKGFLIDKYDNASSTAVVAKGAKSGASITVAGIGGGRLFSSPATIQGAAQTSLKTKLSVAYSSSANAPGTIGTRTSEMPAALFVISNSANVNGAKALITKLNFLASGSLSASAGSSHVLNVYKSETIDSNQLIETTTLGGGATSCTFGSTSCLVFGATPAALSATLAIDPGSSLPILVTLDTTATAAGNATLSVGMPATAVTWSDGLTPTTVVNSLPLSGKSISFN